MPPESTPRPDSALPGPVPGESVSSREASGSGEPTLDGAFSPDGVDLTVIRWMLKRTPEERLLAAQRLIDAAWALRGDEA